VVQKELSAHEEKGNIMHRPASKQHHCSVTKPVHGERRAVTKRMAYSACMGTKVNHTKRVEGAVGEQVANNIGLSKRSTNASVLHCPIYTHLALAGSLPKSLIPRCSRNLKAVYHRTKKHVQAAANHHTSGLPNTNTCDDDIILGVNPL